MTRYEVLDAPLEIREAHDGEMVYYSDVADLERRYRDAVDLLKSERDVFDDDAYDRWDNKRISFLDEEERDMDLHEGPMKTGGNKPRTGTPRPAIDPGAQRAGDRETLIAERDEWKRITGDALAIARQCGDPRD